MASLPSIKDMLKTLVALPSVSSTHPELDQSNLDVIHCLANWLESLGFTVTIQSIPYQPHKANLIAHLGTGENGLILSGHTDTVPYDSERWDTDPFQLIEQNEKWFGLGTSDMKGFFPIALKAVESLVRPSLKQPLLFIATADEECTMSGAKALPLDALAKARYALIGEPTNLTPIRKHKGLLHEAITLRGQAGHASHPTPERNAINGMATVLNELEAFKQHLEARFVDTSFDVKHPTISYGSIHGGNAANRICAKCTLVVDIRILPENSLQIIHDELVKRLHDKLPDTLTLEVKTLSQVPALETPNGASIITVTEELSNCSAASVAFGTEGPYFTQQGIETVILGPGHIDQAHKANEYLSIKNVQPMQMILNGCIHNFCMK